MWGPLIEVGRILGSIEKTNGRRQIDVPVDALILLMSEGDVHVDRLADI